jgi:hypothetical protein
MPLARGYQDDLVEVCVMVLSFILTFLSRSPRFVWSPSLDWSDRAVYSTLLPGAQY